MKDKEVQRARADGETPAERLARLKKEVAEGKYRVDVRALAAKIVEAHLEADHGTTVPKTKPPR